MQTDNLSAYIPGSNYLADYCIEHFGAIAIEEPKTRPPFPCLTGASNTSDSYKIDQNVYPNIVAAGIDTLHLNFGIAEYKHPDIFKLLSETKDEVKADGYKGRKGKPVDIFGQEFMILARGSTGGYEYLLKNGDLDLLIMPEAKGGKPSPEIRMIFRSSFLWREGEIQSYNKAIEFLNKWAFIEYCQVSRADLCVDMVIPLPEVNRMTQVVTKTQSRDSYYGGDFQKGQRTTGYQFGRGGISCRFYDKAYEISVKNNRHITPTWTANGWDEVSPVSRLELQLRRDGLRRFDSEMDFVTLQDCKSDIWAFGTEKYLRIVDQRTATRKERATVTNYWKGYQDCVSLFGERRGVLPYKQPSSDWQPLLKQAAGCLSSAWARLAADSGDDNATRIINKEWEASLPGRVIENGSLQKTRFMHLG